MSKGQKRRSDGHEIKRKRATMLEQVSEYAPSALGVFRRAYAGNSLRAAVDAHCLECCAFDRESVRECTAPACPLWSCRPYQAKRTSNPLDGARARGEHTRRRRTPMRDEDRQDANVPLFDLAGSEKLAAEGTGF